MPDVQDTAEYKLNKSGRKVRAHKIVFNKGEEESMRKPDVVNEVLSKDDPASKWISDFVKSDNPKFEGKSKKKRINMALGAYYAAKRGAVKEEVESLAEMIDRVRECALLDEAVEVSHDRYMRSHSKKASGGNGTWMFTHKPMGSVDYKDESQVHSARGSFSDAKKSAQQWAKKNGHSRVYVMEELELDEAPYTGKGNHRPGWMLRADPELAAKLKKNIDAAKLRQKYMGKTADEIAKMKKG